MVEGSDGRYYLQAGAMCIAGASVPASLVKATHTLTISWEGSWRLEDKLGMPLEDIHTSGNVPQCTFPLAISAFPAPLTARLTCPPSPASSAPQTRKNCR